MAHKAIEEAVEALLEPILDADGIELVDVEYVRERNWKIGRASCRERV